MPLIVAIAPVTSLVIWINNINQILLLQEINIMITIVIVWLCLITHVTCDVVITVNNNGSDNDTCCVNGICPCSASSLSSALHNVSDNTVINITSESVTLHDIVGMGSGNLNNITITGNGATIMCNNTGRVYCESCSDITIMGITWYQCGRNNSTALAFINSSSEILIQDCTFRNCPVYVQNAKGNISIKESNFIMEVFFYFYCDYNSIGLYISFDANIVVAISSSRFNGNDCAVNAVRCACSGVRIEPSNDAVEFSWFLFKTTNFSNYNYGLHLNASSKNAVVELFDVNVYNNDYGIIIQMTGGTSDSSCTVDVLSATFVNNPSSFLAVDYADAVNISSAIFLNNYGVLINANAISVSSATFINSTFLWVQRADTVDISSDTFMNNTTLWVQRADTISISSATFVDNAGVGLSNVSTINIASTTFVLSNSRYACEFTYACTINVSSVIFIRSTLQIEVESGGLSIEISNSYFYNNSVNVVQITFYNRTKCPIVSIVFTNVTFYKTGTCLDTGDVLYINTENCDLSVMLNNVNFTSNYLTHALLINNQQIISCRQNVFIQLANCTFNENFALDHVVAMNIKGDNNVNVGIATIELSGCDFYNSGGKSIVYVNVHFPKLSGSVILDNSTFHNNKGTALHLAIFEVIFKGNILFISNSANVGAALYLEKVISISFEDDSEVQFINNFAELKGGAMYINLVDLDTGIYPYCNVFNSTSNTSKVSFSNNSAAIAGDSIYFNIPTSCQIITDINNKSSLLYYPNMFKYLKPFFTRNSPVVTSPYNITLYPPAIPVQNSNNDYFMQESKMLGEPIQIIASVFDYFSNITESVTFYINCKTCDDKYTLSTYQISIHNQSMYELKIVPTVAKDVVNNINFSIVFLSALSPLKHINASLSVKLSQCRAGYFFDNTQRQCICYSHSDLVHCKGYYVEIKIGFWIGYITEEHYTSSICPNNYCSSKHTETSPGYYSLHGKSDDQCSSHRTGVACGKCKSGYTLAYDSPDCINTDKCSIGMTILVIVLTILYWIAIVAVVFGLMYFQFQISSGYAYGIIYYYSIVDILLVNDVSEEVFHLFSILSSFAKLSPQLFGELCLVEGLSGIDQQFIHYSHALAVSLILLIIVLVAKYSPRLTRFVGRCIIHVICILLLLSYTSLASTSLQLLRPLIFNDVDEVRTYSSPDIKYFTGRHLVYAIVAILCEVIIVIGLPLFLLLEPFLRRRVNLVRIKPLLDQFQGCYKDKYRWFAAYYLICRQVIILIVYVGNGNYYYMLYGLQTVCVIIAMIHGVVQPYKNNLLNGLDEVILVILVLIVNLNLFSLSSFIPTNYFSVVLVILPLLVICFIAIRKLISYFFVRKKRELQLYNPVGTHEENDRNNERR